MFYFAKKYLLPVFLSMGITAFVLLVSSLIYPDVIGVEYFKVYLIFSIVVALIGSLVFKTGVLYSNIWTRRIIVMTVSIVLGMVSFWVLDRLNIYTIIIYISVLILFSTVSYYVADKIEKNHIRKINDRLRKMNGD
jgi:hypothetical protein